MIMSRRHNILFLSLIILGIIAFIATCFQGDIVLIGFAVALLGAVLFGWGTASEYAVWGKYYKDVYPINEEQIKLYQELRENLEQNIKVLEEEIKLKNDYHRECEIYRASLLATVIIYRKTIRELVREDDPNNVKYANRWLKKGQEIRDMIDEAYAQNPDINLNEIFEGLVKLEKEIDEGTVDINRE